MKLNASGYKLIQDFEGLRLKPYLCSAGVPTIGFGNTKYLDGKKVTMSDPAITLSQAMDMFIKVADGFAAKVASLIKKPVTQNQFNAVVSFAYNVGLGALEKSTLLKKLNANPNDPTIANEFAKWNKAGGKVNNGLTKRRAKESQIYFQ